MKNKHLIIALLFLSSISYGQVPQSFNYQAVVRNSDGEIMYNQQSEFEISILQSGTVVYSETHNNNSGVTGIVNLKIGEGINTFNDFSDIDWSNGNLKIRVAIDNQVMGESELVAVPFAMYAENAGSDNDWSTSMDSDDIFRIDGKVGIGTATPDKQLHLLGDGWIKLEQNNATNGEWAEINQTGFGTLRLFQHDNNGAGGIDIRPNGRVGVGTQNPEKQLHLFGDGWIRLQDTGSETWADINHAGTDKLQIRVATENSSRGMDILSNGRIGIGTGNPEKQMHLYGDGWIRLQNTGTSTWADINHTASNKLQLHVSSTEDNQKGIDILSNGNVGIGNPNPTEKLDVNGTTKTKVLEITGGSDVVEKIDSDYKLEPGDIVVLDPNNEGKVKLTSIPYDKKVAGVISGANGVKSGLTLSQEDVLFGEYPLAMMGRVYAKVTGKVEIGDLITTSDKEGYGMAITDYAKSNGTVIGKAMSAQDKGEGYILLLVNLQ